MQNSNNQYNLLKNKEILYTPLKKATILKQIHQKITLFDKKNLFILAMYSGTEYILLRERCTHGCVLEQVLGQGCPGQAKGWFL